MERVGGECDGTWGRTRVASRFADSLRSFHDYNGSERFMRLYDTTTRLSVSLSLACRSCGTLSPSRYLFGKV